MKRLLAMLLALALTLSLVPATALPAFAEETVIEETIPEVTEPLETEPEVTEPEVTEPEVTEPEVTEPEVTEPEETEPEETEFEVTEPEETEPEVTEPEVTEPDEGIAPIDETATQEEATAGVIASGTVGEGVNWVLTEDGTLTFSGTGAIPDYSNASRPAWYQNIYRNQTKKVVIKDGVTSIGANAFYYMCYIESVELQGNTLTTIDTAAFSRCDALTTITIPDSVTTIGDSAFSGCTALSSITIPDGVTTIGDSAFSRCTTLTSVTIPDGVIFLGNTAFYGCTKMTSVTIPDSITGIGKRTFESCTALTSISIPDSVTIIDASAFQDCTSLTSVVIPDSVTTIGSSAFESCTKMTSVTIPDSVTSIGESAFACCHSLTSVTVPGSISSLGDRLFEKSINLTSVTFLDGSIDIGAYTFYNCRNLTSVIIPNSIKCIGESAFYGCTKLSSVTMSQNLGSIKPSTFYNCVSLTSFTIPDSVLNIDESAFYGCTGLTSVTIPGSVVTIGDSAFYGCTGLNSVTILNGVNTIGENTFRDCTGLTSVAFPDSVTSIGACAFYSCTGLTSVTVPGSVTNLSDHVFQGCTALTSATLLDGVTGIGVAAFYGCTRLTSITIPDGVTSIGRSAFGNCSSLPSITVPDSVTTLGELAFYYCTALTTVTFLGGITSIEYSTFDNCTSLASVTLPDSLTSIGSAAFRNCDSLTSVTLPDNLTTIAASFTGCSNLTSINIPASVTNIYDNSFEFCTKLTEVHITDLEAWLNISFSSSSSHPFGASVNGKLYLNGDQITDLVIPESITTIKNYAFTGCSQLASVTMGDSVTSIGKSAFKNCKALTDVTLGRGITSIGESCFSGCTALPQFDASSCNLASVEANAFYGCTALAKVLLPGTVTSIGDNAFYDCIALTEILLPDAVTTIGENAFYNCQMLTEFTVPSGLTSLGAGAFYNCYSLGSAVIPEGVTAIEDNTFYSCYSLTSVSLPETLTTIGVNAFYQCFFLYDINLPDAVTSIGNAAFFDCESLPSVKLPANLTSLGKDVFSYCFSMLEVSIPKGVTAINSQTFAYCNNLITVTIPDGVTAVGANAFFGCGELRHVLFTGTEAKWNKITMAEGNDLLTSATRHFGASGDEVTVSWDENGRQGYCNICDAPLDLSTMSIEGCIVYMDTAFEYTGSYIRPEVTLLSSVYGYLEKGTDFTVSYKNNKKIGFATATVTGIGDFTGTITLDFYICPRQVQNLQVSSAGSNVHITFNAVPEADYYLIYKDSDQIAKTTKTSLYELVSLGREHEYTVYACKDVGDYYFRSPASETVTFTLYLPMEQRYYTLEYSTTIYDGTPKEPSFTVYTTSAYDDEFTLKPEYYTYEYRNNTEIGTAYVDFIGVGIYAGTLTAPFTILPGQVTGVEVVSSVGSSITIAFDPVPGATEYWIYQGSTRKAKIEDTTYTFTGLTIGTTYNFSVKANTNVDGVDYTGAASQTISARPSSSIESYTLTLSGVPKTYTGKALKPTVKVVTDAGKTLSSTYYTVTCTENVDVGTATVTVTGKGKYSGTLTATYDIVPPKAAAPTVKVVDGVSVQVSWKAVKQAQWYEVFVDGVLHGRTSELTYVADGLTPGKSHKFTLRAGATMDGKDYIGALSGYTSATPRHSMSSCTVALAENEFVYSGSYIKPVPTVYGYQGEVLTQGVDYTLSYVDSKNTGRATVKVTGKGAYTGTASEYYYIYPAQVTGLKVSSTTTSSVKVSWTKASTNSTKHYNVYVNGEQVGRTTYGYYNIKGLTLGEIYSVYVVPEKALNSGTYYGAASETIEVWPGTYLGSYKVTLAYTKGVYEGAPLCPSVVVKSSTKASAVTLVQDVDYTVEYVNNDAPGTASVIIRGINAYVGSITKTFTVNPAQVTGLEITQVTHNSVTVCFDPVPGATEYWVYQGTTRKARITDTSYTFTGLTAGTTYKFSVKANGISGSKNYTGTASASVSAKPVYRLEEGSVAVKYDTKVYTGKALTNTFTVKGIDGTTIGSSNYTVAYENNVEMGTATVTITGKGKCIGQLQTSFNIGPKAVTGVKVTLLDGTSAKVTYSALSGISRYNVYVNGELAASTEGTEYVLTGLTPGIKNSITVRGVIYDEHGNTITGVASSAVTVTPRHSMSICTLELAETDLVYNGSNQIPPFTVYGYEGAVLTQGVDYTVSLVDPKNTGRATIKVTGKGAYTGSISQYYYIYPAQVTGLKVVSTAATSVKVSWTKSSTYSAKYYNVYVNGEKVGRTTEGSYTITGLTPGAVYSVYVIGEKTLASGTYYGAPSDTLEVRPA